MSKTFTDICIGDAESELYLRFGATRGFLGSMDILQEVHFMYRRSSNYSK